MNVGLGGVLALLALLGYFGATDQPGENDVAPVSDLKPERVKTLSIGPSDRGPIMFEKRGEQWWVITPFETLANDFKIRSLLSLPTRPSLGGFRAAGNDLSQFGLEPPLAILQVANQEIRLGATEPIDGRRYLELDGQVHLVEDIALELVPLRAAHFVNSSPLAGIGRIEGIRWSAGEMRWDGRAWQTSGFSKSDARALDPDALNQRAEAWLQVQAITVQPLGERARTGEPISFWTAGNATALTFTYAIAEHEVILGRSDLQLQYHLLKRNAAPLFDSP